MQQNSPMSTSSNGNCATPNTTSVSFIHQEASSTHDAFPTKANDEHMLSQSVSAATISGQDPSNSDSPPSDTDLSSEDDLSEMSDSPQEAHISMLPNEMVHFAFQYLPPLDFIRAGATCKHWYTLSESSLDIWIKHCHDLWHDKQVISRSRREIEEGFRRMFTKNASTGEYALKEGQTAKQPTSTPQKERLPIKTLKYLLDKWKVDYADCFTRPALEQRYEEYMRKKNQKKEIKVVDKLFEECKKPKFVYFKSIRQSKSLHIPIHILCSYQWLCIVPMDHNDPYNIDSLLPEFRESFVYYSNGVISPLSWRVQDLGRSIQLSEYPKLVVSRREYDWAFIMRNNYVTLCSIAPHKRVDASLPLNIHELMRASTEAKDEGNRYFLEGEYRAAIMEYQTIFHFLKRAPPPVQSETASDEDNANAKLISENLDKLTFQTYANLSACYLALHDWARAKSYADRALHIDKYSVKALFRRGRALLELGSYMEAQKDLQEADLLSRGGNPNIREYLTKCNRRLDLEDTSNATFSYSNWKEENAKDGTIE
mmetsp:Transcript_962/g.3318  ORF Transcript_962/g.3318 Transcript_962/m.3318 type:complete len:541 (+) Transcript_962:1712-3334(+)